MEDVKQNQPHLDIELSEEIAEGVYSNLAIITHSQSEFVIDFIKIIQCCIKYYEFCIINKKYIVIHTIK